MHLQAYICGYFGFVMLFVICLLCRDTLFSFWHLRGAIKLHNDLYFRVLRAPLLFFLRTPVGDILNAFAKDMDTIDETLPGEVAVLAVGVWIATFNVCGAPVPLRHIACRRYTNMHLRHRAQTQSPSCIPTPRPTRMQTHCT